MKQISKISFVIVLALLINACKTLAPTTQIDEYREMDTIEITANSNLDIYRASEKRVNDLLHSKLEVSFDWNNAYLKGKANLTFKPYFYPTDTLILDAKGFQIHKVALVDKIGKKSPLEYGYDSLQLKIWLDKTYKRTDTFEIFIDYTAMPNKLKEGGSAAITSDKGLYFINNDGSDLDKPKQIWTQGETEASSCWFPTIDSPNEKTTQEIYITVDSVYETLSNGSLIFQTENEDGTRTDYWKQELPHAPYLFMMAVGDFAIVKDEWNGKPVHYYVEHEYAPYARDIYANTVEMLGFFSDKLGYEYPWDKYHQVVVRDYVSGAMENTGAVIYGEFAQGDDRYLIDNSAEEVVAHELFHHWFGDLVTCESWSNLPLNESFATYGEYLWNEYKYGKDEADYGGQNDMRIYVQQSKTETKNLIRFHYDEKEDMFDTHSYQKGGRVLHMLRKYVGDKAFFKGLNHYLVSHEFRTVEIHQLRLAFEEITGEDLNWFFNQWFLGAGHPIIEVSKTYHDSISTLVVTIEQTQEGDNIAKAFQLPTTIGFVNKAGKLTTKDILINKRIQEFSFQLSEEPILVNLDVHKELLAEIEQAIERETATDLYRVATNYVDRFQAVSMLKRSKDSIDLNTIEIALEDSFWNIRRAAINNIKNLANQRPEKTLRTLKLLAQKDEKSSVRSAAIDALANHFKEDVDFKFFMKGIKDKSFSVVSSSLEAIYEKDKDKGITVAEELEGEDNPNLQLTIARIYSEDASPKRQVFFENTINTMNGFSKYPLLVSYSEYLRKQDNTFVSKQLPLLQKESMGDAPWYVRMSAVNGIVQLKEDYTAKITSLNERIKNEEDPIQKTKLQEEKTTIEKTLGEIRTTLSTIKAEETDPNLKRILKSE